MADHFHIHGGARCTATKHHASCPTSKHGWQFVCGTATPHRCLHLDPSIPGVARVVKALKGAGLKVQKGMKMKAKKR